MIGQVRLSTRDVISSTKYQSNQRIHNSASADNRHWYISTAVIPSQTPSCYDNVRIQSSPPMSQFAIVGIASCIIAILPSPRHFIFIVRPRSRFAIPINNQPTCLIAFLVSIHAGVTKLISGEVVAEITRRLTTIRPGRVASMAAGRRQFSSVCSVGPRSAILTVGWSSGNA